MKEDDGLPQNLCEDCIKVLQLTFTFRSRAARSEEQFRILIQENVKEEIKAESDQDYDDFSIENILKYDSYEKEEINEENEKEVYTCPTCNKIYTKENKYLKHLELHQSQYTCAYCSKQFLRESTLQKHLLKHNVNRCQICGDIFANGSLLIQHIATHNVPVIKNENDEQTCTTSYSCDECKKSFSNSRSLSLHQKKHRKEVPLSYTCDFCEKEFLSKPLVKRHLKLHAKDKPFKCTECSRSYSRLDQLKVHMKTHLEQKPNTCPYCNKSRFLILTAYYLKKLEQHRF